MRSIPWPASPQPAASIGRACGRIGHCRPGRGREIPPRLRYWHDVSARLENRPHCGRRKRRPERAHRHFPPPGWRHDHAAGDVQRALSKTANYRLARLFRCGRLRPPACSDQVELTLVMRAANLATRSTQAMKKFPVYQVDDGGDSPASCRSWSMEPLNQSRSTVVDAGKPGWPR